MTSSLDEQLAREMEAWEAFGLRRSLAEDQGRDPQTAAVDFVSNDYLGLSRHPEVIAGARAALAASGAGAGAARLLGGDPPSIRRAEIAVAEWLGAQDALLFPSGYQANLGLLSSLANESDALICDELIHASLIDGARLSRARIRIFEHSSLEQLQRLLREESHARRRLIVVEGVYSMDGDLAPLHAMAELARLHGAQIIVDEAHSVGVIGPRGAGAWAAAEADESVLAARIVTGGKALGSCGACVVGSRVLREHLVNHARSFIFTTASNPAAAGAFAAAVPIARAAEDARAQLHAKTRRLAAALDLPAPAAAILPFLIGDSARAVALSDALRSGGLDVRAVRPPTVPQGTARLRIVCHAHNSDAEIELLIETLSVVDRAPIEPDNSPEATLDALVITGTDTGVGKTIVSTLLARAARRRAPSIYWKPVQTGDECDTAILEHLAGGRGLTLVDPGYRFDLPASPHEAAAAEDAAVDPAFLDARWEQLLRCLPPQEGQPRGTLLIEFAGGLQVPLTDDLVQVDWLRSKRASCVLVARSGLGTLNHTLLSLEALSRRGIGVRALFLVGPLHPSNRATLARLGKPPRIFEVPLFSTLAPAELDAWLEQHDLEPVFKP